MMPLFPFRPASSRRSVLSLDSGWMTSKYRFGRSNPVTSRTGLRSSRIRSTSSCTLRVAVAVNAPTTGRFGRLLINCTILK